MQYSGFLEKTLQEAATIASSHFGRVSGTIKGTDHNQVLTEADIAIGKHIISCIQKDYSSHNIIDEETGIIDKKSEYTWIIDPIDGTSNFAAGSPLYGVMIGLLKEDTLIASGIILPYFQELYLAEKGSGALCNGKQIHVTKEQSLLNVLVSYSIDSHREDPDSTTKEMNTLSKIVLESRNLRASGSCFDICAVAKGTYGAFMSKSAKIWDIAAEQLLVEEAGGMCTTFDGTPVDYSNPLTKANDVFTYCMASPELHEQIQKIIHS